MPGPLCQLDGEQIDRLSSRIVSRFAQERLPAISRVELFLTENCTLRCDYCFVCAKDLEKRMSWDTAAHDRPGLMPRVDSKAMGKISFIL